MYEYDCERWCEHAVLLWEWRDDISRDAQCIVCGIKTLREDNARVRYGPQFDVTRYRYDVSKQALETLIADTSPNVIPLEYLDLMKKLVDRKPYDTVVHSMPTGTGAEYSSLMMTLHPLDATIGVTRGYVPPTILDPDDVPPNEGWRCMSVEGELPPGDKKADKRACDELKPQNAGWRHMSVEEEQPTGDKKGDKRPCD